MKSLPEPVITAVSPAGNVIKIEMSSGIVFEIPAENFSAIKPESAGILDTSSVRIDREGLNLIFGAEEIRIPITAIVVELVGEKSISSELSRRRGSVTSKAKKEAVRDNGKLGGRPLKAGADPKRRERYLAQKSKKAEEDKNSAG